MSDRPPQRPPVIPYRSPSVRADRQRPEDDRPLVAGCGLTLLLLAATVVAIPALARASDFLALAGVFGAGWTFLVGTAVGRGVSRGRWDFAKGVSVALLMVAVPILLLVAVSAVVGRW